MLGINGIWPQRPTDAEYIEQVRRSIRFADRWWWWLVSYYLGFTLFILLISLSATWQWIANILHLGVSLATVSAFSGYLGGWIIGCALGALFGFHLMFLFPLLFTRMRTERLLLHYVEQSAESVTTEPSGMATS